MRARVRRPGVVVLLAVPLAIAVGLLSVGEPADGWGASTSAGITTQATHTDHSLTAPRRARFADDVLRVLTAARARAPLAPLMLLAAAATAFLVGWRRRTDDALPIPLRLRPGETPAALRAPPLLRTT